MESLRIGELFRLLRPRILGMLKTGCETPIADLTMTGTYQTFVSKAIAVAFTGHIVINATVELNVSAWTHDQWIWAKLVVDGTDAQSAVTGARAVNIHQLALTWEGEITSGAAKTIAIQIRKDNNTYNTVTGTAARSKMAWLLVN